MIVLPDETNEGYEMTKLIKISESLKKVLKLCALSFCISALLYVHIAFAQQKYADGQAYYKDQSVVQRNLNVYEILKKHNLHSEAFILEQFRNAANGNKIQYVDEDAEDIRSHVEDKKFTVEDYGRSTELGTDKKAWDWYDNAQSTAEGVSIKTWRDSEITDLRQALNELLVDITARGIIKTDEALAIEAEADNLIKTGTTRAMEAAAIDGKGNTFIREIRDGTADALSADNSIMQSMCPSSEILRAKYQSGCWSCLVVEKLTSAFLTAAKSAYGLSQRAGVTLLWIGVTLWLLMWALKNVSSLAQVEPGNILNELIKFMFKVGLAYWFIMGGLPMVRDYFITPLMGMGSSIAHEFWHKDVIDYTDNFIWEDEVVTEAQEKEITENIARNNQEKLKEIQQKQLAEGETPTTEEETSLVQPEAIQYDSTEAIVQDIQKAFISILQKQLNEIKNSCGGACGSECRFSSCSNSGHRAYVAKIHAAAGSGFGGNVAYCQASITAAMNQLNDQIGGNVADILKKVGAGCALGLTNASKYKNGFSAASTSGGNVTLCVNGQMAKGLKLNVGDTVYYHKVKTAKGTDQKMGATSGYHAVTYTGGGGTISFNGDGQGSMCNSFYYNVQGRVACLSCMIREKLKNNPQLAQGINNSKLSQLASGYNVTLINYSGGIYSGASEGSSGDDMRSLIINIDDVKYKGPTDIMPKSVMNSILGATKAITNITAENMILGDAIMCYSTLERGGAWTLFDDKWWAPTLHITNAFMWIEGFIIFCFGMLLTLAIVYYLMDMSFKIGFAVIALPIVVGLWPFNMTKGKFSMCISIIAKGAATFAFLALTTSYTVEMTKAVINWGDTPEAIAAGEGGIQKLYSVMDEAGDITKKGQDRDSDNFEFAAAKLTLFSTTFVLLMFAFLYSFKLVQNTVPDLVNKFFPDKAFGETNPMHQWATAASRWVKDQAMKPVGYARDIALNQAGEKLKGLPKSAVGFAKSMVGKGSGDSKTLAGRGMRGAGSAAKGAGKVTQAAGKGVQGIGKGLSAVGKGLQAIPVVGNVVGGAMMAAGKATEAAGKGVEMAGKGVEKAGDTAKKAGDATDKAYNEFGTRNKKSESDKDK